MTTSTTEQTAELVLLHDDHDVERPSTAHDDGDDAMLGATPTLAVSNEDEDEAMLAEIRRKRAEDEEKARRARGEGGDDDDDAGAGGSSRCCGPCAKKKKKPADADDDAAAAAAAEEEVPDVVPLTTLLLANADRTDKLLMALGFVSSVVMGVSPIIMALAFGKLVQDFADWESNRLTVEELTSAIYDLCLIFVGLGAGAGLVMFLQSVSWISAGERQSRRIRERYYQAILAQDITYFDVTGTGEIAQKLNSDVEKIQEGISDKFGQFIQFNAQFVAGITLCFATDWKMTFVLLTVFPLIMVAGAFFSQRIANADRESLLSYGQAGNIAQQVIGNIRTVNAFSLHRISFLQFSSELSRSEKTGVKRAIFAGLANGIIFFFLFSAYTVGFLYGTQTLDDAREGAGDVVQTFFSFLMATFGLAFVAPAATAIAGARASAYHVFSVLDAWPGVNWLAKEQADSVLTRQAALIQHDDKTDAQNEAKQVKKNKDQNDKDAAAATAVAAATDDDDTSAKGKKKSKKAQAKAKAKAKKGKSDDPTAPPTPSELLRRFKGPPENAQRVRTKITGRIEFKNVTFAYPTRPHVSVLKNFNLSVRSGEAIALVGHSGSGKSTIVGLLQRFYDPQEGTIELDGVDIRAYDVRYLRQQLALVAQEPTLFSMSIRENIALGAGVEYTDEHPAGREIVVSDDDIKRATQQANIAPTIESLPNGYDTEVGERGAQLSGGQKQRIAIARSMVRKPKILLLDEATSALDNASERQVQEALDVAAQGRTSIIIAHRLSTIRNADRILVLHKGEIREQGTHTELMKKKSGMYCLMMSTQAALTDGMVEEPLGMSGLRMQTYDTLPAAPALAASNESNASDGERKSLEAGRSDDKTSGSGGKKMKKSKTKGQQASDGSLVGIDGVPRQPESTLFSSEDAGYMTRRDFARMLRLTRPERAQLVFGCLSAVGMGGVFPVYTVIFSEVMAVLVVGGDGVFWSFMFLVIAAGAGVFSLGQNMMLGWVGERYTRRLRQLMFQAVLRQDVGFFDIKAHNTGALTTMLANDAAAVQRAFSGAIGVTIQTLSSVICATVIAFVSGWELALVVYVTLPLMIFVGYQQMRYMGGNAAEVRRAYVKAGGVAMEGIESIRTVVSLGAESRFCARYSRSLDEPMALGRQRAFAAGVALGGFQVANFASFALGYYYGLRLILRDNGNPYQFDQMMRVVASLILTGQTVGQSMAQVPDIAKSAVYVRRIFALIDHQPSLRSPDPPTPIVDAKRGEVSFDAVEFRYPTRPDVRVLKKLRLAAQSGKVVALVGASGSGKSTVIQLLERFYDPHRGRVAVNGVDVREQDLPMHRATMSLVSQEPVLFVGTVAENIAYGKHDAHGHECGTAGAEDGPTLLDNVEKTAAVFTTRGKVRKSQLGTTTLEEVQAAARAANIHDFISKLPDGYDTAVGERGVALSGGQKQRVAIARAMVRNPSVLLLDEATSALDAQSEARVQSALARAGQGRTVVEIAHRLSTIQHADTIFVFDRGVVVEQGTHEELKQRNGVYAGLLAAQGI